MASKIETVKSVFDADRRRLLKAFHAFKSDPSEYNLNRIAKAVKSASDSVYVENAVHDFANSISSRPKYSNFSELLLNLSDDRQ